MASLTLLSGTVSHLSRLSSTSGYVSQGRGQIQTHHRASFRIDNRPAVFQGTLDLGDGEPATAAGYQKGGEFRALAVRNDSTGVTYAGHTLVPIVLGALLVLIGLPMLAFLVGFLFVPAGLWAVWFGYRNWQASALLASAPAAGTVRASRIPA